LFYVGGWTDGRTDRHDEANIPFWQVRERALFLRIMNENTSKDVSIVKPDICVVCALSGVI